MNQNLSKEEFVGFILLYPKVPSIFYQHSRISRKIKASLGKLDFLEKIQFSKFDLHARMEQMLLMGAATS